MIQLQVISRILTSKSVSIVLDNNLTEDYFSEYQDEYNYILDHFNQYKVVPDVESFLSNFPDVELVEVKEPDRYLVDTIREE